MKLLNYKLSILILYILSILILFILIKGVRSDNVIPESGLINGESDDDDDKDPAERKRIATDPDVEN